jgi:hypothetical protein
MRGQFKNAKKRTSDLSPAQVDAILNHGTQAHPTTELGKLMKKADKLSMIDFDLLRCLSPTPCMF